MQPRDQEESKQRTDNFKQESQNKNTRGKDENEKPDIIIRDALDKTRSVKEDGALVNVLHVDSFNGTFLIMVYYPAGALEHYLFKLDKDGAGKVVWGTAKATGPIITNKLMVADCKK